MHTNPECNRYHRFTGTSKILIHPLVRQFFRNFVTQLKVPKALERILICNEEDRDTEEAKRGETLDRKRRIEERGRMEKEGRWYERERRRSHFETWMSRRLPQTRALRPPPWPFSSFSATLHATSFSLRLSRRLFSSPPLLPGRFEFFPGTTMAVRRDLASLPVTRQKIGMMHHLSR